MSRPTIRIHDLATDTVVDREMNDAEFATWQEEQAAQAAEAAELAAKTQARQALLDKLGITEDEAKLLLGGN